MARTSPSRFRLRTVVRTRWPAARSCKMQWLAMKPDPPVTRMVLIVPPPSNSQTFPRKRASSLDSADPSMAGPGHHALALRTEFRDAKFDHVACLQVDRRG